MEQQPRVKSRREEVYEKIHSIWTTANVMGANDSELPALRNLMDAVRSGEIDPELALEQAHQILDSKNPR